MSSNTVSTESASKSQPSPHSAVGLPSSAVGSTLNFRHAIAPNIDDETRSRATIKYLFSKACSMHWMSLGPAQPDTCAGVLIRTTRGEYLQEPAPVCRDLLDAVKQVRPVVALTMSTEALSAIFDVIEPDKRELQLQDGAQIQIYASMAEIASSNTINKSQYAALIRYERVVLIWHDDLQGILSHAMEIESRLLALIWGPGVPGSGLGSN